MPFLLFLPDASQYAHYVFNTMKQYGHNGCLTFEQFLQVRLHLSEQDLRYKLVSMFVFRPS